ncbi:uclacyanin 1 [Capsella rubella]|uniref:uclacyanin 1 n=1 Tax=Capsella rubella TaxID=81985 RepID=UPI000CD53D5B|nr:uclacyanin 1 [Capsella rubella]
MVTKKIFGFVLVIMFLLLGSSSAKTYKVGGSNYGWTIKDNSWTEHKEFHVGDSLVFEYDKNVNDVTQVSNALQYESCDNSSPKVVYNTGHDVVTFKEPGHHYFITSNHIECVSGLNLDVLVVPGPSRPSPPPPSRKIHGPSRQIPPPPPPPPSKILPSSRMYAVGDSSGWSVYNSYYYEKWSEDRHFRVGDTLFFEYNKHINDVREVSNELDFESCTPTSTVAVYKTGHDLVTLTRPGVHYFVSLKTGLCHAGIKLRIMVQPSTEDVTLPDAPKKLSPIGYLNRWWLRFFRPHH